LFVKIAAVAVAAAAAGFVVATEAFPSSEATS